MKKTSNTKPWQTPKIYKLYTCSPRPANSPNNSIKYNCPEISSLSTGPETILEITKKPRGGDLTNHRKKTNKKVVFCYRPLQKILKYRDHRSDIIAVLKTSFLQTHIKEFYRTFRSSKEL